MVGEEEVKLEEQFACHDCGRIQSRLEMVFWRKTDWSDDIPYRSYCADCYKYCPDVREQKEILGI